MPHLRLVCAAIWVPHLSHKVRHGKQKWCDMVTLASCPC
ncbi:hypothetical protein NP493_324g00035 [Ridgeia piscesae]|uniref:Uncharacterized protein n=1 Tax=Ridgeia piscesae TaxID=27915 RepID=A0AAD9NVV3_RIDPI|nr:hypothetical protein NP493_324g00035 [Ridgeia piscesae]